MSDDEGKVDAMLSADRGQAFEDGATTPHVADDRLAAKPLPRFTPEEIDHLAGCAECRVVLAARAREDAAEIIPLSIWRRRLVPLIGIAAVILSAIILAPQISSLRSKGETLPLIAEVTMTATDRGGLRRDVRNGDAVALSDKIGFKYGNPGGKHGSLTILGWDGRVVHWYFPEAAGKSPATIEKGERVGVRLPIEIELDGDHSPGPLTIVAQFDAEPSALAKIIEQGRTPQGEDVSVFRLNIVEAQK